MVQEWMKLYLCLVWNPIIVMMITTTNYVSRKSVIGRMWKLKEIEERERKLSKTDRNNNFSFIHMVCASERRMICDWQCWPRATKTDWNQECRVWHIYGAWIGNDLRKGKEWKILISEIKKKRKNSNPPLPIITTESRVNPIKKNWISSRLNDNVPMQHFTNHLTLDYLQMHM